VYLVSRPKVDYETRSINRGFRMKPSVLKKLKELAHIRGISTNSIIENLIIEESMKLRKEN